MLPLTLRTTPSTLKERTLPFFLTLPTRISDELNKLYLYTMEYYAAVENDRDTIQREMWKDVTD